MEGEIFFFFNKFSHIADHFWDVYISTFVSFFCSSVRMPEEKILSDRQEWRLATVTRTESNEKTIVQHENRAKCHCLASILFGALFSLIFSSIISLRGGRYLRLHCQNSRGRIFQTKSYRVTSYKTITLIGYVRCDCFARHFRAGTNNKSRTCNILCIMSSRRPPMLVITFFFSVKKLKFDFEELFLFFEFYSFLYDIGPVSFWWMCCNSRRPVR